MIVYSIIMFAVTAAMLVVGVMVYRGRTNLIHAHHQSNVKDKAGYAKAMGKALMCIAAPFAAAGVIALFTASAAVTGVLVVGLALAFVPLAVVQKKYNGGMFG